MSYRHGIFIEETTTALTPMTRIDAPTVAIGTARQGQTFTPVLCYTYQDFVDNFGVSGSAICTLEEVAYCFFRLVNVAPVIFINVADSTSSVTKNFSDVVKGSELVIDNPLFQTQSVVLTSGTKTLTLDADYQLEGSTISILDAANISDGAVTLTYSIIAAATNEKIIQGIDVLEQVYPRLSMIPGTVIAPGFSIQPTIAQVLNAAVKNINGCFKSIALCDLNAESLQTLYQVKSTYPIENFLAYCWPKVSLDDRTFWLSTALAALMNAVDAQNDQIPYESPSNKRLPVNSSKTPNGSDLFLSHAEANTVNGWGIITAFNFAGYWRAWGSRMSVYPSNDDPKDSWLPVRRMFNWLGNTLVVNYFSRVDLPISRRLVDSIVDEANTFMAGLTARGVILGGQVYFLEEDNPKDALIDGRISFKVYFTPPPPAKAISFNLEYQVDYFNNLFG